MVDDRSACMEVARTKSPGSCGGFRGPLLSDSDKTLQAEKEWPMNQSRSTYLDLQGTKHDACRLSMFWDEG